MKTTILTPAQLEASGHNEGACRVVAGPGSGKTMVLTRRYARLVEQLGVEPRRILAITFTSKAGAEMRTRIEKQLRIKFGRGQQWIGTMHSSFRSILMDEWGDQASLLDGQPQHIVIRDIAKKGGLSFLKELKTKDILSLIDRWRIEMLDPDQAHDLVVANLRCNGLGHIADLNMKPMQYEVPTGDAEVQAMAYRQVAAAYHLYQRMKQERGWVDFTDMIYETWRLLKNSERKLEKWRGRWDYVMVDEFQDIDPCQWEIVKMLAGDHGNLFVVGDDDQCCPPGTLVTVQGGSRVPIENLTTGDHVVAYSVGGSYLIGRRKGFPVTVAKRQYRGKMHAIALADGHAYRATTNHRCMARWSKRSKRERWYCVYLMQRRTLSGRQDWRVGWCQLRRADGCLHLNVRLNLDHGDAMWVLHTTTDPAEASLMESRVATKYRVSTVTFTHPNNATHYTQENLDRFWAGLRADDLIEKRSIERDFNVSLGYPLLQRKLTNTRGKVVFEIHPTNVIPMLMEMATDSGSKSPSWVEVSSVTASEYEGDVYSLDVERHHTFLASGVVTHNCIYKFRGAKPSIFTRFEQEYPDSKTVLLDRNFRCPDQVVQHASRMIKTNRDRLEKEFVGEDRPADITFTRPDSTDDEAKEILAEIKELRQEGEPLAEMVLVYRTHAESLPFETILMRAEIPYLIRNGGCFYDIKEVAPLIEYIRIALGRGDTTSISTVANKPNRFIPRTALKAWREAGGSLDSLDTLELPNHHHQRCMREFALDLRIITMNARGQSTTSDLLEMVMRQLDYETWAKKERGLTESVDSDLNATFNQLRSAAIKNPDPLAFIREVQRTREFAKRRKRGEDAILLSTFHGVKGLEFETVFLTGMCERVMPHPKAVQNGNVGEERRLAHVGWTRTKKAVHVSSPASEGPPSRFVLEWQGIEKEPRKDPPVVTDLLDQLKGPSTLKSSPGKSSPGSGSSVNPPSRS